MGQDGRADCNIDAGTVVVGGIVRGTISSSEKVIVLASAMVVGDISAPRLVAEDGVIIDGRVAIRGEGEARGSDDISAVGSYRLSSSAFYPSRNRPSVETARATHTHFSSG